MDIEKLIETFEKMDISKPFSKTPNPQRGSINVRDTEYGLTVSMFELKKNIGELDNSGKLKYLNGLNLPMPKRIFFDINNDRVDIIEQAFFQAENDWYDFIEGYKKYLVSTDTLNRNNNSLNQIDINGTIEDLTEANLKKHGFDHQVINYFLNPELYQYEHTFYSPKGIIFASRKEGKIYSGHASARKVYFEHHKIQFPYKYPQLIIEFYELKLAEHLKYKKDKMGAIYDENSEREILVENQILWANDEIRKILLENGTYKYKSQYILYKSNKEYIETLQSYLAFLSKSKSIPIQQNEIICTKPKLNMRQIALLCVYLERSVTKINAKEVAKDYGVETTGNKFYQFFSFYNNRRHRINIVEGSTVDTTYENKIELLESVIGLLEQNTPAKDRAIDELKLLKTIKD